VVVGSSVAVRPEPRFEPLMGPFVNTVALRNMLRPDMSFCELVSGTRSVLLDALDHATIPFPDVVESVRPERDGNHSPLVRVLAVLQDAASPPRLGSASVYPIEIAPTSAQFDLTLALRREDGLLRGRLEYDADLFDHRTVVEWAEALRTLLEAAVADGELPISTLPEAARPSYIEAPRSSGNDRTAPSERARFEDAGAYTQLEQVVALAIAELLGVPRVERDDDFFELGGHSLLAAQLISTLGRRLGKELPLEIVFDEPTVSGMASAIAAVPDEVGTGGGAAGGPVAVVRDGLVPLSSGQRRLWFLDRLVPGGSEYVVSAGWRVEGRLDRGALAGALSVIVARHEVLRTRVVVRDGEPWQQVDPPGPVICPELSGQRICD
jgi:non-ribosomal peptide synthetase component F